MPTDMSPFPGYEHIAQLACDRCQHWQNVIIDIWRHRQGIFWTCQHWYAFWLSASSCSVCFLFLFSVQEYWPLEESRYNLQMEKQPVKTKKRERNTGEMGALYWYVFGCCLQWGRNLFVASIEEISGYKIDTHWRKQLHISHLCPFSNSSVLQTIRRVVVIKRKR